MDRHGYINQSHIQGIHPIEITGDGKKRNKRNDKSYKLGRHFFLADFNIQGQQCNSEKYKT